MANTILYGYLQKKDIFNERVTEADARAVETAIAQALAEHNRQIAALGGLFAQATTDFKVRYKTPATARLQPLDENGRARPIKPAGFYDIGLPLDHAGIAWGANFISNNLMTVADFDRNMATMLGADIRWMRDYILGALFRNTNRTYTDPEHGSLTVKPLANGDTDSYLVMSGADAGATDTHFLAQAAAVADATDPLPTMIEELLEHPENSGEVVIFVPTANKAAVEGLTAFVEATKANIAVGANVTRLTGNLGAAVPGEVIGYHTAGAWLVHWRAMPADYLIGVTTGGETPLAMRQYAVVALQGFEQVAERNDYPWYERQYFRAAGFGAWARVGAVVQRVGNGTYAAPAGYVVPPS